MKVKKLTETCTIPTKAHVTDAGFDLYADLPIIEERRIYKTTVIPTGIAIGVPKGWFLKIEGRSSLATKGIDVLGGVVDHGYTGEVKVVVSPSLNTSEYHVIKHGDKIAQGVLLPVPECTIEVVEDLGESDRGTNGFGSSGR